MAKRRKDSRKGPSESAAATKKAVVSKKATGKKTGDNNKAALGEKGAAGKNAPGKSAAGKSNVPGRKQKAASYLQKGAANSKKAGPDRQTTAAGGGAGLPTETEARAGRAERPRARDKKTGSAIRRKSRETVPIVGIGASAGGLEAFMQLLAGLPADTGMAFVMVSHLSHTHKSMLSELLAKATTMGVSQINESTPVAANRVYVIPPNMNLSISDGLIEVSPIDKERRAPQAIDFFLRSLAENRKSGAIGVLLSGTGTDGTLGLAAIKAEGGITFAQDEASARYADMPRSAAQAGAADFVLSPDQIAIELTRIARHPYVVETRGAPAIDEEAPPPDSLSQIFALIRAATGVDFSFYKPTTIKRRVARRMLLHKVDRMDGYLSLLKENPGELQALYQDLLINVTGFFRDADAFQFLQDRIIPKIVAARKNDAPIRAWIPGCASGEEAYSVAICLLEALDKSRAQSGVADFRHRPQRNGHQTGAGRLLSGKHRHRCLARTAAAVFREDRARLSDQQAGARLVRVCGAKPRQGPAVFAHGSDRLPQRADLSGHAAAAPRTGDVPLRAETGRISDAGQLRDHQLGRRVVRAGNQ